MTRQEIETKFKAVLANFFHCKEEDLHADTNFIEDFGIDSLGLLVAICIVEEAFEIENGDKSRYFQLVTYEKALEYLCERCETPKEGV